MGRVRLSVKRLESHSNRQSTYCKRRCGILKKAQEISVLCDIDIILLLFSPTGKPTLFQGGQRCHHELELDVSIDNHCSYEEPLLLQKMLFNFDEIIAKFAQLTPQERAKRKLESLEVSLIFITTMCSPLAMLCCYFIIQVKVITMLMVTLQTLRKTFKKLDNDIGVPEFLDASDPSVEELHSQVKLLQSRLTDVEMRLNWWSNPDNINKVEDFALMECALRESLNAVHVRKLQKTTHLHLLMNSELDGNTHQWHPENKILRMPFPQTPNILPQENMGYFGDNSVAESSHVQGSGEVDQARQDTTAMLDNGVLNDLTSIACLRQQLSEQYSYNPNEDLDLLERNMLDPQSDANLKGYLMDYAFQRNFNLTRSVDSVNYSAVDAVAVPDFDEKSYAQPATSSD
ncbi:agamous-like MADS-box protein AGL65 isoform X1 [Solanum lycopersicum]|uniref:agamous-like MADS-box protein AGL65 isoform X1 n=2 Tax=Solanum lycopersicum TaxID=4081 RepID=UPI000532BD0A|nr:agamous-like MADS-box protein AGL65 isoform X1 [Solanum lycopersicum]XP_019068633.1 agamous-like MADS-box protein AGL65 isoform X1 [Solanum lycopersicum]XP_025885911.1 agamous-like MADS-box protein AGL65 isoform X1 [Solanum lycopersicum]